MYFSFNHLNHSCNLIPSRLSSRTSDDPNPLLGFYYYDFYNGYSFIRFVRYSLSIFRCFMSISFISPYYKFYIVFFKFNFNFIQESRTLIKFSFNYYTKVSLTMMQVYYYSRNLKVKWSTGKEWKVFLEDSHFVWFPTESILYLHYKVVRIHLGGTE